MKKKPSGRLPQTERLVVCLSNRGFRASLEPRKIYSCVGRERLGRTSYLRIIDESGEDYLYPEAFFASVRLAKETRLTLALAS